MTKFEERIVAQLATVVTDMIKCRNTTLVIDRVEETLEKNCANCKKNINCDNCAAQEYFTKLLQTI